MDSAAATGSRERPAGFVPLLDTTPGTRPATPRAPFMPSPRKRAKGTPQKLRVPLRETALTNDGARARNLRSPVLSKPVAAMEEQEDETEEVHAPPAPPPSRMTQARADAARAASRRTAERTPLAATAKPGEHTPFTRAESPGKSMAPGYVRSPSPRTLSDDRTTLLTRSKTPGPTRTAATPGPSARAAAGIVRIASPPRHESTPRTGALDVFSGTAPAATPSSSGTSPARRTVRPAGPRPATAMSPTRSALGTAPPRPGTSMATVARSPVRIVSGERSEAPRVRTASPERSAPLSAAPRPLRAKITDGVPRRTKREAPFAPPAAGPSRAPTALGTVSPTRAAPAAALAPRALPQAAERVDVDAVAEELGESSFLLDDDDVDAGADGSDSVLVHVRYVYTH
ncbi:hypothetical protein MBRA1_001274 [Malassezia brasiliensis]|uniref:Uncharacterized protein n=1 Tax=Malassezia brasiliensis TaxID=1821822 RepID=A0AAF0DR89_9BASI|nr:hypothetical protein MBRA1_001274 [Malassezia brasiliensis]